MTVTALRTRDSAHRRHGEHHARTRHAELLALAARGHHAAFMRFYDETVSTTYALELRRWEDPELAELLTQARYVRAWDRAADFAASGLSPLAWLLSLDLGGRRG